MTHWSVVGLIAFVLAVPVGAQDSDGTGTTPRPRISVEDSPLPRARTLRPPSEDDEGTRLPGGESGGISGGAIGVAIETRPIGDLTDSEPDVGGQDVAADPSAAPQDEPVTDSGTPLRDPVAEGDATTAAEGDLASGSDEDDDTSERVTLRRVGEDDEDSSADEGDEATDGKTRWQRARARRFRKAPKTLGRLSVNTPPPIVPITLVATELKTGARLRQLDKMTGQTETFDIAIGENRQIARLQIQLDACRAPDDNSTSGTMAFLKVWDTKPGDDPAPEFTGWMFADSPALSALDHPRYDLWVINCNRASAPASASNE